MSSSVLGVYVEATLIRHGSLCNIALNFIDFSSVTFYNKVTQQYLMPRFFIFWNFLSVVKFRYSLNVFVKLMNIEHSYFNMRTFLEWFLCYYQVFLFPAGPLLSTRTLWERKSRSTGVHFPFFYTCSIANVTRSHKHAYQYTP